LSGLGIVMKKPSSVLCHTNVLP